MTRCAGEINGNPTHRVNQIADQPRGPWANLTNGRPRTGCPVTRTLTLPDVCEDWDGFPELTGPVNSRKAAIPLFLSRLFPEFDRSTELFGALKRSTP